LKQLPVSLRTIMNSIPRSLQGVSAMSVPHGLIEAYIDGPVQLRRSVANLTADQLVARPVPGKWSTLEVVCHLVDSEQAWCHRLEQELALLEGMRWQMALILRKVDDAAWSFTGVHSERGLMTLEELLRAEVEHIPHHLGFIAEKRRALGISTEG
jgi:uncharacterized damage-inducible protein DinB